MMKKNEPQSSLSYAFTQSLSSEHSPYYRLRDLAPLGRNYIYFS